jgi:hypothetical protein
VLGQARLGQVDQRLGLDVLRKIAVALSVSADVLLFDSEERGPDEDFRLRFEALTRLDPDERMVIKELIDGMLLKHEARRLAVRPEVAPASRADGPPTATLARATSTAKGEGHRAQVVVDVYSSR